MQNLHDVMRKPRRWVCGLLLALFGAAVPAQVVGGQVVKVAAASNLKGVMDELTAMFKAASVQVTWGASGSLAQQIRQGLPVALFISADEVRVDELVKERQTQDAGQRYATGRLALLVPKDSRLPLEAGLKAVVLALNKQDKLAIANPQLAPYGIAAVEALRHEGVESQAQTQFVLGENIAQTTNFVVTGAAQAGITALSLAQAPEVAQRTRFTRLPAEWHAPLHQKMVLLQGAPVQARQFRDFLLSPEARAVFRRHGYDTPP
jgi:molybdate transport system substrate-binding protein